jgi:hypothetical protein
VRLLRQFLFVLLGLLRIGMYRIRVGVNLVLGKHTLLLAIVFLSVLVLNNLLGFGKLELVLESFSFFGNVTILVFLLEKH